MKQLSKFLNEKTIQLQNNIRSWEDAINLASFPLLKSKSIEKKYISSMKEVVNTYGTYMVLRDYFALMHARPENGVNKTAMSMLILNEPVTMKDQKIKIFLILAAKDNNSHIEALSMITELFSNDQMFNKFLSSNKEEILKIIEGR